MKNEEPDIFEYIVETKISSTHVERVYADCKGTAQLRTEEAYKNEDIEINVQDYDEPEITVHSVDENGKRIETVDDKGLNILIERIAIAMNFGEECNSDKTLCEVLETDENNLCKNNPIYNLSDEEGFDLCKKCMTKYFKEKKW